MNTDDRFMLRLRQTPRPEFTESLYARLAAQDTPRRRPVRRLLAGTAVAALLFTCLFVASPEVRAQVEAFVERVTGVTFGDVEVSVVRGTIGGSAGAPAPVETMSVGDAQAVVPFELPTWVPDGYVPDAEVDVVSYGPTETGVAVVWQRGDGPSITLSIMSYPPQPVVGTSYAGREVDISGDTGVVFVGSWDAQTGQYGGDQISIVWERGGLGYFLTSEAVSETDLLRMARSFPPGA